MAADSPRPARVQTVLEVVRTETLSPHLVRVHLGGEGFAGFVARADPDKLAATDTYVKLLFAQPALGLQPPYDLEALRATLAPADMPSVRTYTVRSVDAASQTIAIDFVVHGDEGIAGPWAAAAAPGDLLAMMGPGAGYAPSTEPGIRFLFIGDDSSIPAIAAAIEVLDASAEGLALIEIAGPADEIALATPAGVEVRWLHRGAAPHGTLLAEAVTELTPVDGPVDVFAHGEREAMKAIGRTLTGSWGLSRRDMSLSAYWAAGRAEDTFQAEKREPVGQIFDA